VGEQGNEEGGSCEQGNEDRVRRKALVNRVMKTGSGGRLL
jgi:hypothetical protein